MGRIALAVAIATLPLAACGGDDTGDDAGAAAPAGSVVEAGARPAFGLVDAGQAAALAVDPGVTVLDVRTPEEFAEGHIDGAVLVDFSAPTFADEVAQLDPSQPYLVYCRSGNRSGQAVAVMQGLGFDQLWDLDGGVIAWSGAGLALVP